MSYKYAILKLKGGASKLFQDLIRSSREGEKKISTWEFLRYDLRRRYVPAHHRITNYKFSKSWKRQFIVMNSWDLILGKEN